MEQKNTNTPAEEKAVVVAEEIGSGNAFVAAFEQQNGAMLYCSRKAETPEEKAVIYNAINNPDVKLADHVNNVIVMRDIIVQSVNVMNEKTGEPVAAPRVTIIDTDGNSYSCVSVGVYNALLNICGIFGRPSWPDGLPVKVRQINRGSNRILTLDAAL